MVIQPMTTTRPFALRLFVPSGLPEGNCANRGEDELERHRYVIPSLPAQASSPRGLAGRFFLACTGVHVGRAALRTRPSTFAYIGGGDPLRVGAWSSHQAKDYGLPPTPSPSRTAT